MVFLLGDMDRVPRLPSGGGKIGGIPPLVVGGGVVGWVVAVFSYDGG